MQKNEVKVESLIKLYLLAQLSKGPKHGYELIKLVKSKFNKDISPSQVYPFLKLLRARRYIKLIDRGSRDRANYALTMGGKNFIAKINARVSDVIDMAIMQHIVKCAHCDCEIYRGGYREKVDGGNLSFCCRNCAKSYKSNMH